MKYIKKLTWLLAIGAGLATTSCSESDDVQIPGGLAIDKEQIEIGAEGGTQQLAISASQNWVSSVDEPWLMLNPANGVGSATANVVVDTTLMNGAVLPTSTSSARMASAAPSPSCSSASASR